MSKIHTLEYSYMSKPDYSAVKIKIPADETIQVEASSMISMDTNVVMKTKITGGLITGLKRAAAGESMVMNEFTAEGAPGEICIAPGPAGDVECYELKEGQILYLQSSSYVASSSNVTVDAKFDGIKGFFGGAGIFILKITGPGCVFFNSYGSIIEIPIEDGYTVDTGYIVAFEENLKYNVRFLGGLKTTLFGGEGLVCDFKGTGKLWIQTRKVAPFANWLWPFRPQKQRNND